MGPIGFRKKSITNYRPTPRDISEERESKILSGGRLKSRITFISFTMHSEIRKKDAELGARVIYWEYASKLSGACCAVRLMVHISNINTLKSIYYAYFPSVIQYGIFFGDNSSNNGKIFTLQRKIIRIVGVLHPELHVEVYLNNQRFCQLHANTYIH